MKATGRLARSHRFFEFVRNLNQFNDRIKLLFFCKFSNFLIFFKCKALDDFSISLLEIVTAAGCLVVKAKIRFFEADLKFSIYPDIGF